MEKLTLVERLIELFEAWDGQEFTDSNQIQQIEYAAKFVLTSFEFCPNHYDYIQFELVLMCLQFAVGVFCKEFFMDYIGDPNKLALKANLNQFNKALELKSLVQKVQSKMRLLM